MKPVLILTVSFLTACSTVSVKPAFEDIQRAPPPVKEETVRYLLQHDRHVVAWIAETIKKCEEFGCV